MTLHSVCVVNAVDPYFLVMIDAPMIKAKIAKSVVSAPFVCANDSTLRDIVRDDVFEVRPAQIINRSSAQIAIALNDTHDDRLVVAPPTAIAEFLSASNAGFVNLDMAGKRACVIRASHKLPQFVAHTPRALIGNARLTFNFLRRNAMACAGHQVHGEKPERQLRRRFVEDRSRTRINVMAAFLTGEASPLAHGIKIGKNSTPGAMNVCPTEIDFHQLHKAGCIIRVFCLELFESVLGHGCLALWLRDTM